MGLASFNRMRRLKAEQEAKQAKAKLEAVVETENTQEEEGLLAQPEDSLDGTEDELKIDPDEVTVKELKAMCDEQGIEYTSKITKAELIEKLEG